MFWPLGHNEFNDPVGYSSPQKYLLVQQRTNTKIVECVSNEYNITIVIGDYMDISCVTAGFVKCITVATYEILMQVYGYIGSQFKIGTAKIIAYFWVGTNTK